MVQAQHIPPTSGLMGTIHWYRFIKRSIVHFGTPFDEQSQPDSHEVQETIVEIGADLDS